MSLAPFCFSLAFLAWILGERYLTLLMVVVSIFLVFDFTFGGDPRHRQ